MEKWKRIIEPAGDSESSGWSSEDSNASCSLSHYRLRQYYTKIRTHSQEGRVSTRDEDDNRVDGCWQDFPANYRSQSKKMRLSGVSQVSLNCSTSVVTLDSREETPNIEPKSGRGDLYEPNERVWNMESEGSTSHSYRNRSRYEANFFGETSTSYQVAEPSEPPTQPNRGPVNSPSIEVRAKCLETQDKIEHLQSPRSPVNCQQIVGNVSPAADTPKADEPMDNSTEPNVAKTSKTTQSSEKDSGFECGSENSVNDAHLIGITEENGEQQKGIGQMPSMDLNQSLISLLECPVCMEYVVPPINQCKRGHLVCSNCKPQLSHCPTCRSRFNETRNLAMEQVAEKLFFPCRNHASGCKGMYLLQNKRDHEANCHYRTYKCIVSHCLWKGFQPDILGHMVDVHKKLVVYGENQALRLKLDTCVHFTQNWIVSAFGQVFRVNFLVSYLRSQIAGCVQYLGPRKYACNFSYTFDICTENRRLLYSRQTHGDSGRLLNVYATGDCFFLRTDSANYFVSDKVIKINLQIKKVADVPEKEVISC